MGNSDLTDLTLYKRAETALAILVSDDGVEKHAVWLPKSQIEYAPVDSGVGGAKNIVLVTLPEWLAIERGLV